MRLDRYKKETKVPVYRVRLGGLLLYSSLVLYVKQQKCLYRLHVLLENSFLNPCNIKCGIRIKFMEHDLFWGFQSFQYLAFIIEFTRT